MEHEDAVIQSMAGSPLSDATAEDGGKAGKDTSGKAWDSEDR